MNVNTTHVAGTVLGTVSSDPIYMGKYGGYAQLTSETGEGPALPSIGTGEIESILGKRINVALIDCEGCILSVRNAPCLQVAVLYKFIKLN